MQLQGFAAQPGIVAAKDKANHGNGGRVLHMQTQFPFLIQKFLDFMPRVHLHFFRFGSERLDDHLSRFCPCRSAL